MFKVMSAGAVFVVSAALLWGSQNSEDAAAKKDRTIRELLEITGAGKLGTQVMEQMGATFAKSMPEQFRKIFDSVVADARPEDIVDMIVPIYAKYFTQEELEGIIAFNKTPLGQKVIQTNPAILSESMAAGTEWGRGLAEKAIARFRQAEDENK